ncbi:MAG: cytochrome C oxidase subunit III [Acidobacteria bacterium]|nr:MAG: cytochrome C oxidase subunit III [Acidobacteriota bacterium]
MTPRRTIDVSRLPTYAFGHHALTWWATWSMILMEGTMLVILLISYFFLRTAVPEWPPAHTLPPNLFWGTLNTAIILVSVFPNQLAKKAAESLDVKGVRLWMIVTLLFGVAFAVVRIFEFKNLNCHWQQNAYGSIVWFNMGFHTAHVLTDMVDTVVLIVLMFVGPIEGPRFVDVSENSIYWNFVVVIWLLIYSVIYLAPRFL